MNVTYTLGLIFVIVIFLLFLAGQDDSQSSCDCPPGWSSGLERICGPKKCFCGGKGKFPGCAPAVTVEDHPSAKGQGRQPGCSPLAVEESIVAAAKAATEGGTQGKGRCKILPEGPAVSS